MWMVFINDECRMSKEIRMIDEEASGFERQKEDDAKMTAPSAPGLTSR